jgi:hypothetical protein
LATTNEPGDEESDEESDERLHSNCLYIPPAAPQVSSSSPHGAIPSSIVVKRRGWLQRLSNKGHDVPLKSTAPTSEDSVRANFPELLTHALFRTPSWDCPKVSETPVTQLRATETVLFGSLWLSYTTNLRSECCPYSFWALSERV